MTTAIHFDLARMTVNSTGTGDVTLNTAVTGYLTFDQAGCSTAATGQQVSYAIVDPTQSEVGLGTYYSSALALRNRTPDRSTNGNAVIPMSNAAQVSITPRSSDFNQYLRLDALLTYASSQYAQGLTNLTAVSYSSQATALTSTQFAQALTNITGVSYSSQATALTAAQQAQGSLNIGAVSYSSAASYSAAQAAQAATNITVVSYSSQANALTAAQAYQAELNISAVGFSSISALSSAQYAQALTNINAVSYSSLATALSTAQAYQATQNITAVSYSSASALSAAQQAQAVTNVSAVSYSSQATALTVTQAYQAVQNIGAPTIPAMGRVTLSTGVPVMTSTVTGAATVYFTPYNGYCVQIYNGTYFVPYQFTELSQATTDATKSPAAAANNSNYDIFVWNDSGTLRATRGPAWSSATTRGTGAGTTELTRVNGILVNANAITNGPAANRGTYVGTIRTNGTATVDWKYGTIGSATTGTAGSFGVWNMYNRVEVASTVGDGTASYTYNINAWRQTNNSATNEHSFLSGWAEDTGYATAIEVPGGTSGTLAAVGIGFDSVSTPVSGSVPGVMKAGNNQATIYVYASYTMPPQLGWHTLASLEIAPAGDSITFVSNGTASYYQAALSFQFKM